MCCGEQGWRVDDHDNRGCREGGLYYNRVGGKNFVQFLVYIRSGKIFISTIGPLTLRCSIMYSVFRKHFVRLSLRRVLPLWGTTVANFERGPKKDKKGNTLHSSSELLRQRTYEKEFIPCHTSAEVFQIMSA